MSLNIRQAQTFIELHGTATERARMEALRGSGTDTVMPPELAALQNPDGGFPYGFQAGEPSTLHHTCQVVDWLEDLGQTTSQSAIAAYAFLRSRQTLGGIWREDPALRRDDLPLWMDPDSTAADIYLTALCAATLLRDEDASIGVDRAVVWLQTQQGRDGLLQGFKLHASWMAMPAFAEMLGQEARPTRRLITGLGKALTPEWAASMIAEMLRRLLDAGYSLRTEVVARGWELLQQAQQPDGSFESEEAPEGAVAATLAVLQVARLLGRTR